jgi:hypothetical protein
LGEKDKKNKKIPSPTSRRRRKKNWTSHECMLSLLIGCMKPLFPKLFVTIFGTNQTSYTNIFNCSSQPSNQTCALYAPHKELLNLFQCLFSGFAIDFCPFVTQKIKIKI